MSKNRQTKEKWNGQAKGSALGNLIFMKLISVFGVFPAYILLFFVAMYYTVKDKENRKNLTNFRNNIGLKTNFLNLYIHFFNFGISLIDRLAFLSFMSSKRTFFKHECINEDLIAKMLEKGNGVILLSAHVGNWEVAGNQLFKNLNTRVNILMLDNELESIRNVFKEATDNRIVNIIPIKLSDGGTDAMIQIHKALSNNEIVCMLGDRVFSDIDSRAVDFFGKKAKFPIGPFAIGVATGAPIIPVFSVKKGRMSFENKAYPPIYFTDVTRKNRQEKITQAIKKYVSILESVVREYPYQWFNFYDYWEE